MTRATRWLYQRLGSPEIAAASVSGLLSPIEGPCCICGAVDSPTALADRALGANFSDRGHLTSAGSDRICRACLWCCSGKPPATLRMWSIAAGDGVTAASHEKVWLGQTAGTCLTNRAAPGPIRDLLLTPPGGEWVATVAYSGQKHVVPYSPINEGGGRWTIRAEDHFVTATPETFRRVWSHAVALRRLGVPEEAVMSGQPQYIKTADQLATWRDHAAPLAPYLGSPLLRLALWTITKSTMQEDPQ